MISILIPLYNGVEFLDECISSVINQTCKNWEVLIGVNGKTLSEYNDICAKIKKYNDNRIRVLFLPNTKGKCKTLNKLMGYAKYDYICLLDIDDKWMPEKLEKQLLYIQSYDVIGTDTEYFGDKSGTPGLFLGVLTPKMFRFQNPVVNSSVMMQRKCAWWNEKWEGLDDYNLWFYLLNKGKRFYNVPEILTNHRIHDESFFNNKNGLMHKKLMQKIPKLNKDDLMNFEEIMDNKKWKIHK